jgi:predicted nucleic acid-binding protein
MRVLVDTNILLRSAQPTHPLCAQATQAVSKLIRQKDAVFFCSQNIAEFWNVATPPGDLNGLGLSHEEVLQEISSIERLLTLVPDIPAIYPHGKKLWRTINHRWKTWRNCLNGRPEWTRTIDLIRVKDAL